ncbi:MAG: ATP-binding protein [Desulfobacterales bacterium]|nr:ATP-binding protein [Desulfobacterales bacterium]
MCVISGIRPGLADILSRKVIFAAAVYLAGIIAVGIFLDVREKTATGKHLDQRLSGHAKTLKFLLSPDFHDRATDDGAISETESLANQEKILAFVRGTELVYAYTLVLKDGKFFFSAPTVTEEETQVKKNWYFHPYEDAPPAFYKALETGEVQYTSYEDQWGRFRSVAIPEKSPNGNTYLACADYGVDYMNWLDFKNFIYAALMVVALLILSLPLLHLIRVQYREYNRELKATNHRLRNRSEELLASRTALEKEMDSRVEAETQKYRLQERLRQSQKMEAIGTLSGGIAHDFNNLLFPILGYSEMALTEVPENSDIRFHLNEINKAATRAKDLVTQILAFSRQEEGTKLPMKIQPIVKEVLTLFKSSIPPAVDLKKRIDGSVGIIDADATQIHQIIMNLISNACGAVSESGGEIMVTLDQVVLTVEDVRAEGLQPGPYARLTVADTGTGIPPEHLDRIFDPFFTTKEKGKGTGLGLSMVHGIVTQMCGKISVNSKPGKGTEISVYLPVMEAPEPVDEDHPVSSMSGGSERLLLVDDDPAVLEMLAFAARDLGYDVVSFSDSTAALKGFRDTPDQFDLIVTDLTMPGLSGEMLVAEIRKVRRNIPVLLCSGFSEKINDENAAIMGIKHLLKKPVQLAELAEGIRRAIDDPDG